MTPRTLMPCALAASATGAKRSILSAMLRLIFLAKASLLSQKSPLHNWQIGHGARGGIKAFHIGRQHRIDHVIAFANAI